MQRGVNVRVPLRLFRGEQELEVRDAVASWPPFEVACDITEQVKDGEILRAEMHGWSMTVRSTQIGWSSRHYFHLEGLIGDVVKLDHTPDVEHDWCGFDDCRECKTAD